MYWYYNWSKIIEIVKCSKEISCNDVANARARIVEIELFLEGNEISRSSQIFLLEVFLGNNRTCKY